jgi:hypothetical protein
MIANLPFRRLTSRLAELMKSLKIAMLAAEEGLPYRSSGGRAACATV